MKILAITQARYGSTRLPAKILKEINGMTLLELHLRRILKSKLINKLKVATTLEEGSKYIIEVVDKLKIDYYQGSVNDVLSRFYKTAEPENPDIVVRFTSDCPLIDPNIIDMVIHHLIDNGYDYVATDSKSFPDGLDVEVFKFTALKKAYEEAMLLSEREHVTPYIWKNGTGRNGTLFKTSYFSCPEGDYSNYRITIDTIEDFQLLQILIQEQGFDKSWLDYINFIKTHTDLLAINNMHKRNEGYENSLKNDCKIF